MGLMYDPLTALFLLLITGVGSLIHVYAIGYMEHQGSGRMQQRSELGSGDPGHDFIGDRRVEPFGCGFERREGGAAVGKADRLVAELGEHGQCCRPPPPSSA